MSFISFMSYTYRFMLNLLQKYKKEFTIMNEKHFFCYFLLLFSTNTLYYAIK